MVLRFFSPTPGNGSAETGIVALCFSSLTNFTSSSVRVRTLQRLVAGSCSALFDEQFGLEKIVVLLKCCDLELVLKCTGVLH